MWVDAGTASCSSARASSAKGSWAGSWVMSAMSLSSSTTLPSCSSSGGCGYRGHVTPRAQLCQDSHSPKPSPVGAAEHSWLCQGSTPRSGMDTQNLQGVPCQGRSSPRLAVPSWSFPSSAIQFRKLFFSFPVLTCPAKGELCVSCLPPLLPNPSHVVQIPITESAFHKELRFTRLL